MCETDGEREAVVYHTELSLVLCDDPEGWTGGGGQEVNTRGRDLCIPRADSFYYVAETQHCKAIILQLKNK